MGLAHKIRELNSNATIRFPKDKAAVLATHCGLQEKVDVPESVLPLNWDELLGDINTINGMLQHMSETDYGTSWVVENFEGGLASDRDDQIKDFYQAAALIKEKYHSIVISDMGQINMFNLYKSGLAHILDSLIHSDDTTDSYIAGMRSTAITRIADVTDEAQIKSLKYLLAKIITVYDAYHILKKNGVNSPYTLMSLSLVLPPNHGYLNDQYQVNHLLYFIMVKRYQCHIQSLFSTLSNLQIHIADIKGEARIPYSWWVPKNMRVENLVHLNNSAFMKQLIIWGVIDAGGYSLNYTRRALVASFITEYIRLVVWDYSILRKIKRMVLGKTLELQNKIPKYCDFFPPNADLDLHGDDEHTDRGILVPGLSVNNVFYADTIQLNVPQIPLHTTAIHVYTMSKNPGHNIILLAYRNNIVEALIPKHPKIIEFLLSKADIKIPTKNDYIRHSDLVSEAIKTPKTDDLSWMLRKTYFQSNPNVLGKFSHFTEADVRPYFGRSAETPPSPLDIFIRAPLDSISITTVIESFMRIKDEHIGIIK